MSGPLTNNPELADRLFSAKRILFIGAHPDDIEFYCGGLVYAIRRAGVEVHYLIATKGGKGREGRARTRLENLRVRHQEDAADILGGAVVEIMDYPDGHLAEHVLPFSNAIKAHVMRTHPDYVFCWDHAHIYNPHPDHKAAAEACRDALDGVGEKVIRYGTRTPDFCVGLDAAAFRAKMKSLRAHRTETPWYYWPIVKLSIGARLRRGGRILGCRYAEVFRGSLDT